MCVYFYKVLLPCQLRILTRCLKWQKGEKPYCCWFLFQCHYYPFSIQVMFDMFIFVFVQHWTSLMKFFHYSVYCLFYTAVWMQDIYCFFSVNLLVSLLHDIFYKSLQMNTLCITECVSHLPALTPNPWLSTYLASGADEMKMVLCDSPVNNDIIFSYTLRAQIFEDCVSVR